MVTKWVKGVWCLAAKMKSKIHGCEEPNKPPNRFKKLQEKRAYLVNPFKGWPQMHQGKEGIGNFGSKVCTETISYSSGKWVSSRGE
ncbi:hypothetical protein Pyn_10130 [Prunus yedoensis var. nudiflora]|uniref:Uncharacterized protein n=1 Tax=Prunus yedoensis var. nudiflora TaxID=2094558 RepID=A0A314YVI3_PRUYE|nr:hypothetical protein Pyn_10130 [Prunus yedoensis var. nudiflora]